MASKDLTFNSLVVCCIKYNKITTQQYCILFLKDLCPVSQGTAHALLCSLVNPCSVQSNKQNCLFKIINLPCYLILFHFLIAISIYWESRCRLPSSKCVAKHLFLTCHTCSALTVSYCASYRQNKTVSFCFGIVLDCFFSFWISTTKLFQSLYNMGKLTSTDLCRLKDEVTKLSAGVGKVNAERVQDSQSN